LFRVFEFTAKPYRRRLAASLNSLCLANVQATLVLKNHPGAAAQKYDSSFGQGELA
jgi:hypothetical protein